MLREPELVLESMRMIEEFFRSDDPAIDQFAVLFYNPDVRLQNSLDKLEQLQALISKTKGKRAARARQESGYVMEAIAFLAFGSLRGRTELKSYQSAGPQHDLYVDGARPEWGYLCRYLKLESLVRQGIVIETKAIEKPLADHEFARLCAILDYNLVHAGMGVFFTLNGASGFPADSSKPQRALRDSRLRQVIYYAKTSRPIIVFDHHDIKQLGSKGALPILMQRKVKEIAQLTGFPTAPIDNFEEVVLPDHLNALLASPVKSRQRS